MASFDSVDGIDYPNHYDWSKLSPEEKLKKINKSRNYIRFKLIQGKSINPHSPILTPEEAVLIERYNDSLQFIKEIKIGILTHFYDNCPKVGSTLKRKEKKPEEIKDSFDWL